MSTAAEAIAGIPPRENINVVLCASACTGASTDPDNPTIINPARTIVTGDSQNQKGITDGQLFAWTSVFFHPTAAGYNVNDLICANSTNADVCGQQIYTTMGQGSDLKKLESVMYDPSTPHDADGGWWVIVPITDTCPPGSQGNQWDPKPIVQYAKVRIIQVCASGSGNNGCNSRPNVTGSHGCSGSDNNFSIDRIACVTCANDDTMAGFHPVLVK
jgi:hypothetical protein